MTTYLRVTWCILASGAIDRERVEVSIAYYMFTSLICEKWGRRHIKTCTDDEAVDELYAWLAEPETRYVKVAHDT